MQSCTWLTARTCVRGRRAPRLLVLCPRRAPSLLDPAHPSLRIPAGEGSSTFPTRGRGGGARAAPWEAEPGGVALGVRIRERREARRGPAQWGAVAPRCR